MDVKSLSQEIDLLLAYFNTNPKSSLDKAEELWRISYGKRTPIQEAHLLFVKGSCEQLLLSYQEAFLHLEEALSLYRRGRNIAGELSCLKNLGANYYKTGDYGESFNHFYKALELAREDPDSRRAIFVNLGVISYEMDRSLDALEYYYLAFKSLPSEDMEQKSIILNNLGECYYKLGEREKALYHFEEAIKIFSILDNQHNLAYSYTETAPLLMELGEWKKASTYLNRANDLNGSIGSPAISIRILICMGLLEKRSSRWNEAFSLVSEALNLAVKYDDIQQECRCCLELKEICKSQESHDLALEYLERYVRLNEQLDRRESRNSMEMINSRIQIDALKREKEKVDSINNSLEKLNDEILLINHLAQEITSSLDLQEMAHYLNYLFKEMFTLSTVGIGIYDKENRIVYFNYFYHNDKRVPPFHHSMDKEGSLAVQCIRQKKALRFNKKEEIKQAMNSSEDHEEESVVYIPLIMKDNILGILTIQSVEPDRFNDELFQLLQSLSSFISIAVSNALNHTRIQQLNEQLLDDKEALECAYGEIEFLACHDPLTGLANRSLMEDFFQRCKAPTLRKNQSMAVLFIDLDGFKEINDNHGHEGGDKILVNIANVLQKTVRKTDMVARYGGDEYVIILREIKSLKTLTLLVEKLRDSIERPIKVEDSSLRVGASLGVAIYPKDGEELDDLLKVADHQMYKDKKKRKEKKSK